MGENEFWVKIIKLIIVLAVNILWAVTGYWTLDRYFQGHSIVTFPATVTQTK